MKTFGLVPAFSPNCHLVSGKVPFGEGGTAFPVWSMETDWQGCPGVGGGPQAGGEPKSGLASP